MIAQDNGRDFKAELEKIREEEVNSQFQETNLILEAATRKDSRNRTHRQTSITVTT